MMKLGDWQEILRVPVDRLAFCSPVLRWLLFVACRIWGPTSEGHLTVHSPTGLEVDIDATPPALPSVTYYFHCPGPPRLPDVQKMMERSTTSSMSSGTPTTSHHNPSFGSDVQERDISCILYPAQPRENEHGVQACHCIPHAKGIDYLRGLNIHRGVTAPLAVDNIDDVRNGLFLSDGLRTEWLRQTVGLLLIPNEYIRVQDLTTPIFTANPIPPDDVPRLVLNIFRNELLAPMLRYSIHNNCVLRYTPSPSAVPAYLLDYVYICAVIAQFGSKDFPRTTWSPPPPPLVGPSSDKNFLSGREMSTEHDGGDEEAEQSNWEILTIIGAQNNPSLEAWRRGVE
uniref:HNH nuclease domain-containing protein n=1 Tax=Mycena chlorophos TaxID=658473 RepID=A0ABQ0KYU0_MYCCL|nr:predicted protein [Mycena chlorophos]